MQFTCDAVARERARRVLISLCSEMCICTLKVSAMVGAFLDLNEDERCISLDPEDCKPKAFFIWLAAVDVSDF